MKFIGIDIGSTCAKTVVMNENKEIVLEFDAADRMGAQCGYGRRDS